MVEHHSILYGPINALLIRLLGHPPVEKLSPGMAKFFFPDGREAWIPDAAIMALLLTALIAVLFPLAAQRFDRYRPGGVQNFLEMLVSFLRDLVGETIGEKQIRQYLPIIGALFVFIAMGNLFGLFFFLQPPTGSLSTTVALAVVSFLYFNYAGHPGARRRRVSEALHGAAASGSRRSSSSSRSSAPSRGSCRCRCASS